MKYNWFRPLIVKNLYINSLISCVNLNAMTMSSKTHRFEEELKKFLNVK